MASQPEAEVKDWSVTSVWRSLKKPVFIPAIIIIVGALIFATWFGREHGDDAFEALNTNIVEGVGWWYVAIVTVFVLFALWAGLSKAGSVRLGRDDEKPEFSLVSWFTMLFSAGMGIGLIFWGVAEPLNHFDAPPETTGETGVDENGNAIMATEDQLAGQAIGETLFHWGMHAWAIYVVVGLGLAYMTFRRGRPLSIRWLLEPIFGRRLIESWVGHMIDVVAIVGTVFGVVTSLGMGVQQMAAGLNFLDDGIDPGSQTQVILIIVITAVATLSVVTGVHKGLKWLSNINMSMAAFLALFVLFAGPTLFLLQHLVANAGEYGMALPQFMFETNANYAGGGESTWSADWTIYYWGWWMSWSPFVGMFIARISRGRTIREFVLGVLLAPTLIAILWFSVFGSSGIYYQLRDGSMIGEEGADETTSLFLLLEQLPLTTMAAIIAILVIAFFFITSSDSGSLVVDVLSHGGRPDTPRLTRVFWAVLEGVAAIVLLTAAGEAAGAALRVLQVASISAAAPLSIVLVLAMVGMIRMLVYEGNTAHRFVRVRRHATKAAMVDAAREEAGSEEGPAVQRTLLQMLNEQTRTLRAMFGATSTTLAGLPKSAVEKRPELEGKASDDMVIAVQNIPASATLVNTDTGVLSWDRKEAFRDPIREDEVFNTPEFEDSFVGWEQEAEEYFDETVATGTIPVTDPEENPEPR